MSASLSMGLNINSADTNYIIDAFVSWAHACRWHSSPNYKGFETFFDLKDKNIANASKQLTGPSGKHNLRMMVKLLEECGFVDVNVFEELQPIKQEKNVS